MTSSKLARQHGQVIASEGTTEETGGAIGKTGDVIEFTNSLVAFEDGVFCRSSSGGAMSGSVRTPFFCSGEFFASGPLPPQTVQEVVKKQLPHCEDSAGSTECRQLWEP